MATRKGKPKKPGEPEREPRRARITTKTAEDMISLLRGRDLELVGRGAHQMEDGTYVAEVIAAEEVLADLPRDAAQIEIHPEETIAPSEARVGKGNRYAEPGSVPRGVGEKK